MFVNGNSLLHNRQVADNYIFANNTSTLLRLNADKSEVMNAYFQLESSHCTGRRLRFKYASFLPYNQCKYRANLTINYLNNAHCAFSECLWQLFYIGGSRERGLICPG